MPDLSPGDAQALQAYEAAFRLQPDDFWTCIELTRLRLDQAGDVETARAAAEAAAACARTDRERAAACADLGDALMQAGALDAARAQYEESKEIREALAAANPGSAEAKRDLSVSLDKLGDALMQAGALDAARAQYQESKEIGEALAAANPGSAEAARDVWVSLWRLATLKGGGVAWREVAARLEAMAAAGTLTPADAGFLEEARRRAAADDA